MSGFYSWQQPQLEQISACLDRARLAHALLLEGATGLGKFDFAKNLAQFLLCSERQKLADLACGKCKDCSLFLAANHPDFYLLQRETNPKTKKIAQFIAVEQIRQLSANLQLKSYSNNYKVVIILEAESMSLSAANSLLKTLEEPTPATLLMLVTAKPQLLLPTIISRCQRLHFNAATSEQARQWLQQQSVAKKEISSVLSLAAGAPLAALCALEQNWQQQRLELFNNMQQIAKGQQNPLIAARELAKYNPQNIIKWLLGYAVDLTKIKHAQAAAIQNIDFKTEIVSQAEQSSIDDIDSWYQQLVKSSSLLSSNVNFQQLLESNLISWQRLFKNYV